jgi:hypothetical protein
VGSPKPSADRSNAPPLPKGVEGVSALPFFMSTITIDAVPDELNALLATPEGMARARAAVLAAFPEVDTRTPREKEIDDFREEQKARYRAKQEKLIADTLEDRRLRAQAGEKAA